MPLRIIIGRNKATLTKKETKGTLNNKNMEKTEVDLDKSIRIGMTREEIKSKAMDRTKDRKMITSNKRKRANKRTTTRNQRIMQGKIMKNSKASSNMKEARATEEGDNNIEVRETIMEIRLRTVLNVSKFI